MAEYIGRESLISNLKDLPEQERIEYMGIYDLVKSQPAADVESVVRCRECKYWHQKTGFCLKHSYFKDSDGMSCSPADSPDFTFFNEDDFCSYGERKEVDTE